MHHFLVLLQLEFIITLPIIDPSNLIVGLALCVIAQLS